MSDSGKQGRLLNVVLCGVLLVLAVVCVWGAGVFDSEIQRDVRVSNVYVAPGVDVDEQQAEQIVGNRQLVIVMLDGPLGDRGGDICDELKSVAAGSIAAIVGDDLDLYGCAMLPGADDENFGKAFVAETQIRYGIKALTDRPIDAVKTLVANFDMLVDAGLAPQEARSIDPPFARYLIAFIALGMLGAGAFVLWLRGQRLARVQADRIERRARARGRFSERDSALGAAGTQILALDERYRPIARKAKSTRSAEEQRFLIQYRASLAEYTALNERATSREPDDADLANQIEKAEHLLQKLARL